MATNYILFNCFSIDFMEMVRESLEYSNCVGFPYSNSGLSRNHRVASIRCGSMGSVSRNDAYDVI